MTGWERFMLSIQVGLLRGRDQTLHNQIANGYFRGDYAATKRREQQKVRAEIRSIEKRLDGG